MAEFIRVGLPLNKAEQDGLRMLRDVLPEHYTVIGNFELQLPRRKNTLEYDAVVIGEYGLFAVEIKGWTGHIRGDLRYWEMDWGRVENPFIHTETKAKALRDYLTRHMPDLPRDVYCTAVVFLPVDGARVVANDDRNSRIVYPHNIWRVFASDDEVFEKGPGYFLDINQRNRVIKAIAPFANAKNEAVSCPPGYEIERELDSTNKPYREFVGRHKIMQSCPKVRIKMYCADLLARDGQSSQEIARAVRDLEALRTLGENPYIARGYEVHQIPESELKVFIISEWVGSETLEDFLGAVVRGEEPHCADVQTRCAQYARHLLKGISFMHQRKIIHRNLHPGVIYLTSLPHNTVSLKIADFDYARVSNLQSIADVFALSHCGQQGYTAPEVWRGCEHDHRADIFSVGIMLYEMITGQRFYHQLNEIFHHDEIWHERQQFVSCLRTRKVLDHLLQADPRHRAENLNEALALFEA